MKTPDLIKYTSRWKTVILVIISLLNVLLTRKMKLKLFVSLFLVIFLSFSGFITVSKGDPYPPSLVYPFNQTGYQRPPNYNYTQNYTGIYAPNLNNTRYMPYNNASTGGHLFLGQIQVYDRLLFNQVYRKESRWWTNREKIVDYPAGLPSGYVKQEVITAIRVYNQYLDGNTARAYILQGGVGYPYVTIKLESNWNKGFQFLVQLYGR